MEKINTILNEFDTISLADLNAIDFMNRVDRKFCFSINNLAFFLEQLTSTYKVLSVKDTIYLPYKTLYYDTSDFEMYLKHHNKVANRYKIRRRTYLENNQTYLEVKSKNNKGRTIKERIKQKTFQDYFEDTEKLFIEAKTPYKTENLIPSVLINYHRITLINNNSGEKVTIDIDLEISNKTAKYKLNYLVIVEVKQVANQKTLALSVLRNLKIKPCSLSKYCLGVNYLYPHIKKNNFKEKLVTLNKIINDTPISYITSI